MPQIILVCDSQGPPCIGPRNPGGPTLAHLELGMWHGNYADLSFSKEARVGTAFIKITEHLLIAKCRHIGFQVS